MNKLIWKWGALLTLAGYAGFRLLTWILIHSGVQDPLANGSLWIPRIVLWAGTGCFLVGFFHWLKQFHRKHPHRGISISGLTGYVSRHFNPHFENSAVNPKSILQSGVVFVKIIGVVCFKLIGAFLILFGRAATHSGIANHKQDDTLEGMPLVCTEKGIDYESPGAYPRAGGSD